MTAAKNDFHFWQRPVFKLLGEGQLEHIYEAWEAEGKTTLRQRAQAKLLRIMQTHEPQPLEEAVVREMDDLLKTVGAIRPN